MCVEDWSAEENLVHSTVTSERSTYLTHQDIQEFTKACAQCNCEKVVDFLVQAMEDTDQKVVMVRVQQLQMLFIVMSPTSPSPKKAGKYEWFIVLSALSRLTLGITLSDVFLSVCLSIVTLA